MNKDRLTRTFNKIIHDELYNERKNMDESKVSNKEGNKVCSIREKKNLKNIYKLENIFKRFPDWNFNTDKQVTNLFCEALYQVSTNCYIVCPVDFLTKAVTILKKAKKLNFFDKDLSDLDYKIEYLSKRHIRLSDEDIDVLLDTISYEERLTTYIESITENKNELTREFTTFLEDYNKHLEKYISLRMKQYKGYFEEFPEIKKDIEHYENKRQKNQKTLEIFNRHLDAVGK